MVATVIPATRAQPFVKNGCPSQCGNVTIPYPFGTKEGWSIMLLELVLTISRIYRGLWPKELIKQREKFFLQNGGIILQQELSKFNEAVSVKIHTSEELNKATNNFNESNTVGRDHSQVEQFTNEVIVLSQVNHRNVVKLFRCLETEVPLLVYKFIANGTLYEHLQSSGLGRECRLRITAETARALSYSNSAAYPPIIHRDVKSSNILFYEHYTAKVSEFGAISARDAHFRVVLAELLTGRKALCFQVPKEERNLAMHYVFTLKKDQLFRIIDHHVLVEGNTTQIQVAMLANRCLRVKGKERPSMKEVATVLEGLRAMLSIRPVSPQESTKGSSSDYGSC
ncbi:wall-associated receptor kinase 5-like [Gossypium raimondii]|uniref:wall-associated receptor kinase 5-like n=1 Tax=Gossypium raimondii TaxID=29730 RepID=UPI00227C642A|nr:wall-associated receptor kinase 5-like [Gossypium raimondii]